MSTPERHVISGAFVFFLLGMFAVFSTMLVLFGTQAYRGAVDRAADHNRARVLISYVRNAVRMDDAEGVMAVDELDGVPVLTFLSEYDGESYVKYVYAADGMLRELFTSADYPFDPAAGEDICAAGSFLPKLEDGLLTVDLTDEDGNPYALTMALRCQS